MNCQFPICSDHKVPGNHSTSKHRLLDYEKERISGVGGVKNTTEKPEISAVEKTLALRMPELGRFLQDPNSPCALQK